MTKPFNKVLYSIMEALSNFDLTDDFPVDPEYIKDKIHDVRSALIYDEWKAGLLDEANFQRVCCLEIKCREAKCELNGVELPSGAKEYYVELPLLNNRIGEWNIKYFGTVDMMNNFNRMSWDGMLSLTGNRWTSNQTSYSIISNEAMIKNLPTNETRFLCLVGILDNPTLSCDWESDESIYPCSNIMKLELVVKQDILSSYGIPKDKSQDTQEATNTQPQQAQQQPKQQ